MTRFVLTLPLIAATLAVAPAVSAQGRADTTRVVPARQRALDRQQQALVQQLVRMRAEIEALRAELARTGERDPAGTRALRTTIESLEQSQRHLESAIREHSMVIRVREPEQRFAGAIAARPGMRPATSAGYVGLTTENRYTLRELSPGRVVQRNELPVIVTVAAGSPADRAGLLAGDTVVSINRRDGRQMAQTLASLLRPGETIVFEVRRGDETREIPVRVEPRVDGTYSGTAPVATQAGGEGVATFTSRPAPAVGGTLVTTRVITEAGGPGAASGGRASTVFILREPTALAGARLEPLSRDLATKLGVERGLYVLTVAAETPSARSGLKAGDVIVGTGGSPLASLAQLHHAMLTSSARALELQVIRDQQRRTVTLRW